MAGKSSGDSGITKAVKEVFLMSLKTGQAPLICFTFIICLLIIKMNADQVFLIVNRLLDDLEHHWFFSYLANLVLLFAWLVNVRYVRRVKDREIERLSAERSRLQAQLTQHKISSSKRKP